MKTKLVIKMILFTILFSSCSGEKTIGINQSIHHDDFEYSVLNVSKSDQVGSLKANGFFYLVTFQVKNQAKQVEHQWDNSIAYLVNENGTIFENSYELQKSFRLFVTTKFNLQEKYNTPAGNKETTLLVFEVPADVKELYLKVRGEFLMGDLFDGNQFKNTKIKLF